MDEWREKEKKNQFGKTQAVDPSGQKEISQSLASALEQKCDIGLIR